MPNRFRFGVLRLLGCGLSRSAFRPCLLHELSGAPPANRYHSKLCGLYHRGDLIAGELLLFKVARRIVFMFQNHLLSVVAYTPLVGALLLLFFNKEKKNLIRWFANIVGAVGFLVSIPLALRFDANQAGFQFIERHSWIPSIGVEYYFGIDGISLLIILLTTGLGFVSIISSLF